MFVMPAQSRRPRVTRYWLGGPGFVGVPPL